MRAETVIGIVCCIINYTILPYDIYWLYQFYQCKNASVIEKRKPGLLAMQHIAFWLWISIVFPFVVLDIEMRIHEKPAVDDAFELIYIFVLFPLLCVLIGVAMSRYWLIFYMIHHNAAIANNQWQSIIDPRAAAKDWYVENKTKYGSWSSIRRAVIVYTVVLMLSQLLYFAQDEIWSEHIISIITNALTIIVPLALFVYMLLKTPNFKDEIGIKSELKLGTTLFAVAVVLVVLLTVFHITFTESQQLEEQDSPLITISTYVLVMAIRIFYLLISLRTTRWPLMKFNEIIIGRHDTERMIELAHQRTQSQEPQSETERDIETAIRKHMVKRNEMKEQLAKSAVFDAFMQLLLTQYCSECLLSVIEFVQFKEKIVNDQQDQIEWDTEDMSTMPTLPSSCPLSSIVYGDEDCTDYMQIATQLYAKYVRVGAPYEINIDYATRNTLQNIFEHAGNREELSGNLVELYELFNPCMEQMMALITPSFTKFKQSKSYQLIQHGQIPK